MKDKKLTILFDANPLVDSTKSGVGYYTKGVIEALASTYPDEVQLVGHYFNFLGKKTDINLPKATNIRYVCSRLIHPKLLSLLRRCKLQIPFDVLIKTRGDIAFFPNFVTLPVFQGLKKVVVVHDLCFKEFPEYLQPANQRFLNSFVPASLKKSDAVVTISESTKKAIQRYYHVPSKKILTTYIPVVIENTTANPKRVVDKEYILFVGTLEPRKNFIALVRAYVDLPKNIKDRYALVLAGGVGWSIDEELTEIKNYQQSGEQIITTGYIDEATKQSLYTHASLFVLPSYYEGFGMPLLEAMHFGVPVVASDIDVFHEVCSDAALYADPASPSDMSEAVKNLLTSQKLRTTYINKGYRQVQSFSWEDNARELYLRFNSITGRNTANL